MLPPRIALPAAASSTTPTTVKAVMPRAFRSMLVNRRPTGSAEPQRRRAVLAPMIIALASLWSAGVKSRPLTTGMPINAK